MYYSYKNCKVLINGGEIFANQADITLASQNSPLYLSNEKNSTVFAPVNGIGGTLKLNYYLTGLDPIKSLIDVESTGVSGYFAGLSFQAGYLRSYSFNGNPNTEILINAELLFFDQLSGIFQPSFEESQQVQTLNFSDASLVNLVDNTIGLVQNVSNVTFNYSSEIAASYLNNSTIPDRVVFGKTQKTLDITTDIISGDLPIYGKQAALQINFNHPFLPVTESFKCEGILYQRDLSANVGQILKSILHIKQNAVEETPIFYYFLKSSGNVGDEVDIFGKNFSNTNLVQFSNGINDDSFSIVSDNEIIAHVPNLASNGPVVISNRAGNCISNIDYSVLDSVTNIFNVSPISGSIGQTINIFGSNLHLTESVKFSTIPASFNIISDSLIKSIVPLNTPWDYVYVSSQTLGMQGQSPQKFVPIPEIDVFIPNSGVTGQNVSISGYGFSGVTGVYFNNILGTNLTNIDNTGLMVQVPSGNTNGFITAYGQSGVYGISIDTFRALALITGTSPVSGMTGSAVKILGQGLIDALLYPIFGASTYLASFGAATGSFIKTDNQTLTGYVPSGATTGPVLLYDTNQTSYPSTVTFYITNGPPVLLSASPLSGKFGDTINIQGLNLFNISQVNLSGGIQQTGLNTGQFFTNYQGNNMAVNLPNISGGSYNVVVTGVAGAATGLNLFTMLVPPSISGFKPVSGIAGSLIALSGTNFYPNSRIFINNTGIEATIQAGSLVPYNTFQFYIPQNLTSTSNQVIIYNTVAYATGNGTLFTTPLVSVKSFAPTSGVFGSFVSVSGSGFLTATGVNLGQKPASFSVVADTGINFIVPNASLTDYVNVYNQAGFSSSSGKFTVITPAILISGFNPTSGDAGDAILISGNYLDTTAQIRFSGGNTELVRTAFTGISTTGILVAVPIGATNGQLKLVNASGTSISNQTFTTIPYPAIQSISNLSGVYLDTIIVSGVNFNGAGFFFLGVTGNLVPALQTNVIGSTGASLRVPREIVYSPIYSSGARAKLFASPMIFTPLPSITGFAPSALLTGGVLTVTGINAFQIDNFLGITGANASGSYGILSNFSKNYNQLTGAGVIANTGFTIISGTINQNYIGSGNIFLISSNDTSVIDATNYPAAISKSYNILSSSLLSIQESLPVIADFNPKRGNQTTNVLVSGSNLINTTQVTFSGASSTVNATVLNSSLTQINVNPPAGFTNTSGQIIVYTPAGSVVSSSYFTYINAPVISGFSPINGGAGTAVLITGLNLINLTGVLFGNTSANFSAYNIGSTYAITGIVPFINQGNYNITIANELGSSTTGIFNVTAGSYYPLTSNPSGYLTNFSSGVVFTGNLQSTNFLGTEVTGILNTIDWNSGTHLVKQLTANTNFVFANNVDALSIQVLVYNTGTWTVTWPSGGNTGIRWPGSVAPVQTTGNKTDIYSFTQFTGVIYGTYSQNY